MASPAEKKQQLRDLLAQGQATLHLDARQEGVRVPPALRGFDNLRLNLHYGFAAILLLVDDVAVRATLTFGGSPFRCIVPWSAVYGVTAPGSKGNVWIEDIPVDQLLRLAESAEHARRARRPKRERLAN